MGGRKVCMNYCGLTIGMRLYLPDVFVATGPACTGI